MDPKWILAVSSVISLCIAATVPIGIHISGALRDRRARELRASNLSVMLLAEAAGQIRSLWAVQQCKERAMTRETMEQMEKFRYRLELRKMPVFDAITSWIGDMPPSLAEKFSQVYAAKTQYAGMLEQLYAADSVFIGKDRYEGLAEMSLALLRLIRQLAKDVDDGDLSKQVIENIEEVLTPPQQ